jgi:hypothetical protein
MQNTELSIILTMPFVDTAAGITDGEPFSGDSFRHLLEIRKVILERKMISTKDNGKVKELRGDLVAVMFNFVVPDFFIQSLCQDIANEIFQHKSFSPNLKILVESKNSSSIVPLLGINVQELTEKIQEIITPKNV